MQATTDISDALQAALATLLGEQPVQTLDQEIDTAVDQVMGEMTEAEFDAIDEAAAADFTPEPEPETEREPEPARQYRRGGRRFYRRSNTANWLRVEAVTITENVEKNGIEIRFPGKPSDTIRDMLKRRGWKFSGNSGCWYHKATDANRAYAREIKALADRA